MWYKQRWDRCIFQTVQIKMKRTANITKLEDEIKIMVQLSNFSLDLIQKKLLLKIDVHVELTVIWQL